MHVHGDREGVEKERNFKLYNDRELMHYAQACIFSYIDGLIEKQITYTKILSFPFFTNTF